MLNLLRQTSRYWQIYKCKPFLTDFLAFFIVELKKQELFTFKFAKQICKFRINDLHTINISSPPTILSHLQIAKVILFINLLPMHLIRRGTFILKGGHVYLISELIQCFIILYYIQSHQSLFSLNFFVCVFLKFGDFDVQKCILTKKLLLQPKIVPKTVAAIGKLTFLHIHTYLCRILFMAKQKTIERKR